MDIQKDETLSCHVTVDGSQSETQLEPLVIQPTKDEIQSQAEPSERKEEKVEEESPKTPESAASAACKGVVEEQPIREQNDAEEEEEVEEEEDKGATHEEHSDLEEEEELVSPVLELDPSLDMEVMKLMTSSSPPPSFLHLSSPSPPPFTRQGKGRTLRPPPSSSRPSDDLSIRLRQSPFSTEASPETSPARTPVTPPPLSPPSPPLRESPPLSRVKTTHYSHLLLFQLLVFLTCCHLFLFPASGSSHHCDSSDSKNWDGETGHHKEEVLTGQGQDQTGA